MACPSSPPLRCAALPAAYDEVRLLDLRPPAGGDAFEPDEWVAIRVFAADICDAGAVARAAAGASAVFHVAAFGMSGPEQLQDAKVHRINVLGTDAVIKGCLAAGVSRLIYVSTYNVVFAGGCIVNGDEVRSGAGGGVRGRALGAGRISIPLTLSRHRCIAALFDVASRWGATGLF